MGSIIAAIIGAIASIGVGITSTISNIKSQNETNRLNKQLNEDNLEYNTYMTQQQWERDDNAHQREVEDLKKAGLSPLANLQGSTNSSALGAPNPISMQAPQIDTNALMNSINSGISNFEQARSNKAREKNEEDRIANQANELELKSKQLELENKKVNNEIEYRAKMLEQTASQIKETKRHNVDTESQNRLAKWNERVLEEVEKQTGGKSVPYTPIYDYEEYKRELMFYQIALDEFVSKIKPTSESKSKNKSKSSGINAGQKGQSSGLSTGTSEGESSYTSISEIQEKEWYAFQQKHKLPVYLGDLYKEYYGHSYYNKK